MQELAGTSLLQISVQLAPTSAANLPGDLPHEFRDTSDGIIYHA